jgi:hypothetical protein
MRQWLVCLALLLGACTQIHKGPFLFEDALGTRTCRDDETTWPDVFPRHAFSFELGSDLAIQFMDERSRLLEHCWSSGIARKMREDSLLPAPPGMEAYRFTWERSFHDYVVIRVEHRGPVHSLHVKVRALHSDEWLTDRRIVLTPGNGIGDWLTDRRILLTPSQWQELRRRLEQARFWLDNRYRTEPEVIEYMDGATWMLEGVRGGSYHMLYVHSPHSEGPAGAFRAACLYLVELSGLSIPEDQVY